MESGVRNCYEVTLRVRDILRLLLLRQENRTFTVEVLTDHDPQNDYRNLQQVTVLMGGKVVRRSTTEYTHVPETIGGVRVADQIERRR